MKKWLPLVALAGAQFIMVLDQSVMNVSISQLVEDFDTTVTTIQAVITLYCLVMAMLMLTGGGFLIASPEPTIGAILLGYGAFFGVFGVVITLVQAPCRNTGAYRRTRPRNPTCAWC